MSSNPYEYYSVDTGIEFIFIIYHDILFKETLYNLTLRNE